MGTVDDPAVVGGIGVGLCTKLKTKVFDYVCSTFSKPAFEVAMDCMVLTGWWTTQGLSNTAKIDDDSLDAVSLPFNLGLETLHLVAVEGIGDILKVWLATSAPQGESCLPDEC